MNSIKTYGQLLDLLIAHYEDILSNVDKYKDDKERLYGYLIRMHAGYGICRCASLKFNIFIYKNKFVDEYCKGLNYLCECPIDFCYMPNYIKTLLQIRIDRMIEVYEKWKDVEFVTEVVGEYLF